MFYVYVFFAILTVLQVKVRADSHEGSDAGATHVVAEAEVLTPATALMAEMNKLTFTTENATSSANEGGTTIEAPKGKVWKKTAQTMDVFNVAGVNLALWSQDGEVHARQDDGEQPFELFEDFNIEDLITGNESWDDLLKYRNELQRPSLSFYVDKVARKRWLPFQGFEQPRPYLLRYAHELTVSGEMEDEVDAILNLIPEHVHFAAKPTHMSSTQGVWLVSYDSETDVTLFSPNAKDLTDDHEFDPEELAESLAQDIHNEPADFESWALFNVEPGIVIEELYTDVVDEFRPPIEFNVFTIWGKVWMGQANYVDEDRYNGGFVHRNGTFLTDQKWGIYEDREALPEWVDWEHVVGIAERLGANKDFFRTDIFAGIPVGAPSVREAESKEEEESIIAMRLDDVRYLVSECEIFPTTNIDDPQVKEEGARLWISGYKIGNYRTVPNTEVPAMFEATGSMTVYAASG